MNAFSGNSPLRSHFALLLLLVTLTALSAASSSVEAAPRHPWQVQQPLSTTTLQVDLQSYTCMLANALEGLRRSYATAATALNNGTLDPRDATTLYIVSLAYAKLERGGALLSSSIGVDELVWREATSYLREGATLLYLAALYGGFDLGEAEIGCGALRLSGSLEAVLAALSSASYDNGVIILPLPPSVQILESLDASGSPEGADLGNPRAEELFRQERLPDDMQRDAEDIGGGFERAPGIVPEPSPGIAAPSDTGGLADINIDEYLKGILGAVGGDGAAGAVSEAGDAGVGVSSARFVDAVGRVTLSVDTLLRLTDALSSLSGNEALPLGETVTEVRSAPNLAGLWIAAGFAILGFSAVIVFSRLNDVKIAARRLLGGGNPSGEVGACYSALLSDLAAAGLGREPWEAPREYAARVTRFLSGEAAKALLDATSLYERVAYGGYIVGEDEAARCWDLREQVRSGVGG